MVTRALTTFALLATLSGVCGCAHDPVNLAEGPREYVATDYDNVLKRWTREESLIIYTELERALTVTATFESWDFRWAYVIRYAQDYRLTIPQRQRLLSERLNESRKHHQFFVALYGAKQKFNDLEKSDSAWIVRLIDATGNETAPSQIERIRKPSILEQRYYPYNSPWRKAFRIRFPATSGGRPTISSDADWVGLRFAGAWGNRDLIWEMGEAGAEDPRPGKSHEHLDGSASAR